MVRLGGNTWSLQKNDYLSRYVEAGYKIRVYQTEHVNYCRSITGEPEYCYTYSTTGLRLMDELNLSTAQKAELIIGGFLSRSQIYFSTLRIYDAMRALLATAGLDILPRGNKRSYDLHSLGTLPAIRKLQADILKAPRGRVFFAHLLLPHAPYYLSSDCQARDVEDWYNRKFYHRNLKTVGSKRYREEAYQRYFEQTRCLLSRLGDLFDAMRREGAFEDWTIVVHGDHGSRITIFDPIPEAVGRISPRDLIDSYSTLFAVRAPGLESGYDLRMDSIQNLLAKEVLD